MMARRILLSADAPQLPARKRGQGAADRRDGASWATRACPIRSNAAGHSTLRTTTPSGDCKDALSELPAYKFRYLDNHATLDRDLVGAAHRPRVQPVRRRLQQRSLQGAARSGDARGARACPTRRRARRRSPPATTRASCAPSRMTLDVPVPLETLRAPRRPGRDAAVGVPGAAEAELRRQLARHHQGRGRQQREGAARLPGPAAHRVPEASDARAGISDRRRILADPRRQPGPGPARAADPRGRLLQARSRAAEDPRLRIQVGARQPVLDAGRAIRRPSCPSCSSSSSIEHSARLFERLGCRDYARFDFRADAKGEIKLLEVNPNPGWCWDGKVNLMAGFAGMRYSELLGQILAAAVERLSIVGKPASAPQVEAAQ